jgi:TM2 domain-containing membrane protein YozV
MKSPGLGAVLSFFICGLGQIYNGQIVKGLIFLVAYFISWWMMYIVIGFITTPILWIWGIVDAYSKSRVRAFNAPPYSRNPHIALAVQRMGWIEEKGSGLARMRDSMMTHGLRPP